MSAAADFVADRTTPTPPQFDTSTSLATMAAVQRALGNYAGGGNFTTNQTLTAANAGKTNFFNSASPLSCVLPLLSSVPVGTAFPIENGGAGVLSVSTQGADTLVFLGSAVTGAKSLGNGDTAHVANIGTGAWVVIGGSIQHGAASVFGASLSGNGYQKIPGGLIIQWGTISASTQVTATFSYPIAFPNACLSIVASKGWSISTTAEYAVGIDPLTTTQFKLTDSAASTGASQGIHYIAIGY